MMRLLVTLGMWGTAVVAGAQETAAPVARPTDAGVGVIGQRQTRATIARTTRIEPMTRINSRIDNRVRSRLRTRLDRDRTSSVDVLNAFDEADERVRNSSVVRPRQK